MVMRMIKSCLVEIFLRIHWKQSWTSLLSQAVHSLLCAAEMSIIEEYERNQQFEQQYISSVVEGMDEMHIICPICHM